MTGLWPLNGSLSPEALNFWQAVPFPTYIQCSLINVCWLELSGDNVFNHIMLEKEIIQKEKRSKYVTQSFSVIYRGQTVTIYLQKRLLSPYHEPAFLHCVPSSAGSFIFIYYIWNNFILQMRKQSLKPSDLPKMVELTDSKTCLPSTKTHFPEQSNSHPKTAEGFEVWPVQPNHSCKWVPQNVPGYGWNLKTLGTPTVLLTSLQSILGEKEKKKSHHYLVLWSLQSEKWGKTHCLELWRTPRHSWKLSGNKRAKLSPGLKFTLFWSS